MCAASISRSLLPRVSQAGSPVSVILFLDVDNDLRLPEAIRKSLVLPAELLILSNKRIADCFLPASLLRPQCRQYAPFPLLTPCIEVRRIQSLPPQQRPKT